MAVQPSNMSFMPLSAVPHWFTDPGIWELPTPVRSISVKAAHPANMLLMSVAEPIWVARWVAWAAVVA